MFVGAGCRNGSHEIGTPHPSHRGGRRRRATGVNAMIRVCARGKAIPQRQGRQVASATEGKTATSSVVTLAIRMTMLRTNSSQYGYVGLLAAHQSNVITTCTACDASGTTGQRAVVPAYPNQPRTPQAPPHMGGEETKTLRDQEPMQDHRSHATKGGGVAGESRGASGPSPYVYIHIKSYKHIFT